MRTFRPYAAGVAVTLFGVSAATLLAAPFGMPESYSRIEHTTSESAGQGVPGAWVARTGFVAFGLAVLVLAVARRQRWGLAGAAFHGGFGVLMIAAAVFSARSWEPAARFDRTEDLLHSVLRRRWASRSPPGCSA